MCSLMTRDQNGYPLEGVDVVSDGKLDCSLSRLIGLLQEANKRADNWKDMTDTLQRKYNALYQDYMALKYSDLCVLCQKELDSTPAGETITLFRCGSEGKKPSRVLNLNWKRCGKRQDIGKTVTKPH